MRQPIRPRVVQNGGGGPQTYTGFGTGTPAGITYGNDTGSGVTLGTVFRTTAPALTATRVRLYLAAGAGLPTSGLLGGLWNDELGTLLDTATFGTTGEGWNEAVYTGTVLTQGVNYVAGVFFPSGGYSVVTGTFAAQVDAPPITFPANSENTNGVYQYAGSMSFPAGNGAGSWYGIDVEVSE